MFSLSFDLFLQVKIMQKSTGIQPFLSSLNLNPALNHNPFRLIIDDDYELRLKYSPLCLDKYCVVP